MYLSNLIDKIVEYSNGDESYLEEHLGEHYKEILSDSVPNEQKQKLYDEFIQSKYTQWFSEPNSFDFSDGLEGWSNDELRDISVSYDDESLINFISEFSRTRKENTTEARERKIILEGHIKKYAQSGYNLYPILRCMQNKISEGMKEEPDSYKKDGYRFDEIQVFETAKSLINIYDNRSPYSIVLNLAKQIGTIDTDRLNATDSSEANKLEDKEFELKNKLRDAIKDLDLHDLESILKNKKYFIEQENTINGKLELDTQAANDLFGLQSAAYIVRNEIMKREQQQEL